MNEWYDYLVIWFFFAIGVVGTTIGMIGCWKVAWAMTQEAIAQEIERNK